MVRQVSPEVIDVVMSLSAFATRPMFPLRASCFMNSQAGSIFLSSPPLCKARDSIWRLEEEALSLGDEVVVMHAGKIVQRGTPTEIYETPAEKFVAEFVGRSNWFNGRRTSRSTGGVSSFIIDGGVEIRARSPQSNYRSSADLCVRPENIELLDGAAPEPPQDAEQNLLKGIVLDVASLGADVHVVVELPEKGRLLAIRKNVGRTSGVAPGQPVRALFSASDVIVF